MAAEISKKEENNVKVICTPKNSRLEDGPSHQATEAYCRTMCEQITGSNDIGDCITNISIYNGRESSQGGILMKQSTAYPYEW